jgi:hypothetical protein
LWESQYWQFNMGFTQSTLDSLYVTGHRLDAFDVTAFGMSLKAKDVPETPGVARVWLPDDDKRPDGLQFGHKFLGGQCIRYGSSMERQ